MIQSFSCVIHMSDIFRLMRRVSVIAELLR